MPSSNNKATPLPIYTRTCLSLLEIKSAHRARTASTDFKLIVPLPLSKIEKKLTQPDHYAINSLAQFQNAALSKQVLQHCTVL